MYAVKGDLIEVKKVSEAEYADKDGNTYEKDELVLLEEMDADPIDWNKVRINAAIETMATISASYGASLTPKGSAEIAVKCADALVEELKKGNVKQ